MESEIFTSSSELRSVFAFVNHGHVIAAALAPHSRARSSSIERESERRGKSSRNSGRNGTMRKKCWHWQFAREKHAKRLEYCTKFSCGADKGNRRSENGLSRERKRFPNKTCVMCSCEACRGGSSQCRSPSPCINIHLNFKTLSAINTTAAFPLLSQSGSPSLTLRSSRVYVSNAVRHPCFTLRIVFAASTDTALGLRSLNL